MSGESGASGTLGPARPSRHLAIPLVLASLTGALIAVGFLAPAVGLVAFVALVPLTLALRRVSSWRHALLCGWVAGFTFHILAYHWFTTLFQQFAGANLPVAVAGTIGFAFAQGSLQAALAVLAWGVWRRANVPLGLAMVASLVVVEHLYPALFPIYLANHLVLVPQMTQSADIGGPLLVSAVAALMGAPIEELISARLEARRPALWLGVVASVVLGANAWYGEMRLAEVDAVDAASPRLRAAIVQGNVGAADKHLRANQGIARYRAMTDELMAKGAHDLVVWPESAYNRFLKGDVNSMQGKVATDVTIPMIVGALRREDTGPDKDDRKLLNTALAVGPGGAVTGHYDKTVLLAFGEYIPGASLLPFIKKALPFTSEFTRGTSVEPLPVGPYRASTSICYEDTIAGHVRALMSVEDTSHATPHVQVNITNDSWYGPVEPPIHLALSTFRAIEHRRWMIRATATGISAFVDAAGRVRARSSFEQAEVIDYEVPMITGGRTVYAMLGDWVGWCAALAVGLGLMAPVLRRSRLRAG